MRIKTYIYQGRRMNTKNKISHFYEVEGEDRLVGYKKKLAGVEPVGGRVEITFDDDDKFFISGENAPRYLGKIDDEQKIAGWIAEERVDIISDERNKLARSDARVDELDELIEPLKQVVSKQVGFARKAAIVKYIEQKLYS